MRILKKSLCILISVIMIVSLLTVIPFGAADAVQYVSRHWDDTQQKVTDKTETCTSYTTITSRSSLTLNSGWYVVNGDATISSRVTVSGDVSLILLKGTLTCEQGIRLSKGNSLCVYPGKNRSGKLVANQSDEDEEATIGGNEGEDCGAFVFYGGTLEAKNKKRYGAACIGGGGEGGNCGKLIFYGGKVTVDRNFTTPEWYRSHGAGIGDGYEGNSANSNCCINIFGGDISVDNHRISCAAAIGGAEKSKSCPINIYGGKVVAKAYNGAGIGSGQYGTSNTITIRNAKIEATSNYGAGVGSGEESDADTIIIENSNVTAKSTQNNPKDAEVGSEGAGIGGGNCGKSTDIQIRNSQIFAISSRYGAGIGGGDERDGGDIAIEDSIVYAYSAKGGAGIGGGCEKGCDSIDIKGSFIVAETDSGMNDKDKEFIQMGADIFSKIFATHNNMPGSGTNQEWYQMGYMTAALVTMMIQGTETGAAIGGGDEGSVNSINIEDSYVYARSAKCAAGIGGGDEGGFGTINIKNSTVKAASGDYGAAIGSGDEAKKCGTINITDSTITADAGTDAAGIGTGNETNQSAKINIRNSFVEAHGGRYGAGIGGGDAVSGGTITLENCPKIIADSETDAAGIGGGEGGSGGTITIKNCSDVKATGGGYAAGIGGGDSGSGGTIKISNSTVKAYGGTDAAGIGGGEDGSGGHIEITDSNVYAKGKEYGAGIGGGEDAGVDYVGIWGNSSVEAVAGSVGYGGRAVAIGNGDYNSFWSSRPRVGTLSLSSSLRVYAGSDQNSTSVYTGDSRFDACWTKRYAKISTCPHTNCIWLSTSNVYHQKYCTDCHEWLDSGDHVWNDQHKCSVCGTTARMLHVKLIEQNNNGEVIEEYDQIDSTYFVLPECENEPDGMKFVCWRFMDDYYYATNEKVSFANDGSLTLTAVYLPASETSYIDEYGSEQTVTAIRLTNDKEYCLGDGWYVADVDTEISGTLSVRGDVNLILADGKTLSFDQAHYNLYAFNEPYNYELPTALNVYGQKNQTGTLDMGRRISEFYDYNQYGGRVNSDTSLYIRYNSVITRGSSVMNQYGAETVTVKGGNIDVDYFDGYQTELGWSKLTDSIKISSRISSGGASVSIAEGQKFTDENGIIYEGVLTSGQLDTAMGKTLTPYLGHDYKEPEWEWINEYRDASAVFKCKDCDEVLVLRANVQVTDEDNIRTAKATCDFYGRIYTDTQTTKILWDIDIDDPDHGTITASKSKARTYDDVQLEITPDDGWALLAWTVTPDDDTKNVETESTSFRMPESDVTVSAEFVPIVERHEPYIDDDGEYHLGNVAYVTVEGEPYAVNGDGTIGERLASTDLSYFDFALFGNYYIIKAYTGPTENLSEIVIPKSYNGHDIDRLYTYDSQFFTPNGDEVRLVLNENIIHISSNAFDDTNVTEVTGDTSTLTEIDDHAFASSDAGGDNPLEIDLYTPDPIEAGTDAFLNRSVTIHTLHGRAYFDRENYTGGAKSITYVFEDAHTYDGPVWTWSDNCTEATATFTCTDTRCGHTEMLDAELTFELSGDKYIVTAAVELDGVTYTDTRELPADSVPRQVEYIDKDGEVRTAWAVPITDDTASLAAGWYYVEGEVTLQNDTPLSGSVKLILCDDSHLTTRFNNQNLGDYSSTEGTALTIYRAPGDNEGLMSVRQIYAETVDVVGGGVSVSRSVQAKDVFVSGGSLSAEQISTGADFSLTGGSVRIESNTYWILNCSGNIYISGGSLYAESTSGGGVSCDGSTYISGGTVEVVGLFDCYYDDTVVLITGGSVDLNGIVYAENAFIVGGNVTIENMLYSYGSITLGWTELSDSIYVNSFDFGLEKTIDIVEDQVLTDGADTFSGSYPYSERGALEAKTLTPYFARYFDRVEPYIDDDGDYKLGVKEHYSLGGKNYAVNADGSMGDELSDLSLSYFEFKDNGSAWQINRYTGPTEDMTVLEIPKTFEGKRITVLGNNGNTQLIDYTDKTKGQYELKLTENIEEIKPYTFYTDWVTKVTGDTSNLTKLGNYAFSWVNSPGGFALDITLDYEGTVSAGSGAFNHMNVTAHLKHATVISGASTWYTSLTYDFTDAHLYGAPAWEWSDDHSSATATFTCTDNRCKHKESVEATVTETPERSKTTYTATAEFNGETYTDTQIAEKTAYSIAIADIEHGTVSVYPDPAYEGEEVTLTIAPDTGYKLQALTVKTSGNKDIEVSGSKFTMPGSDVTVTAVFEQKLYDITYAPAENGWVEGAFSANYGEEIKLTPWPLGGYELDALTVTDADENIIPLENDKFTMPDSDVTVTATFKKSDFTITYGPYEHGTITGAITAQAGEEVPITITPDEGYAVTNVYAETEEWEDPVNIIDGVLYMQDDNVIVYATFVPIIPAKEPWIDENGEYHLGNVAYCEMDGFYFEVDGDRVGDPLDSVDVSYFDFTDNGDSYQINYYMGPTDGLTELVIPKTYRGKPITVLGTDNRSAFIANSDPKPRFTLVLNENVVEIKPYAFYTMWVKKVTGDTSNLSKLGDYAFSWANSPGGYMLDIKLDHIGSITTYAGTFNHMNVIAHMSHSTRFTYSTSWAQSVIYDFTDAHTYGEPVWKWSEDNTAATATFTCTDTRCRHIESLNAAMSWGTVGGRTVRIATVVFEGKTYTDTKDAQTLIKHSLSLDGDIGVNFYVMLPDGYDASNTVMDFSWGNHYISYNTYSDDPYTFNGAAGEQVGSYVKYTVRIAPKELNDTITAVLKDAVTGETILTDFYSGTEYADELYAKDSLDGYTAEQLTKLKTLVKDLLIYAAKAQIEFEYNTSELATHNFEALGLSDALEPVDTSVPGDNDMTDLPDYLSFYGGSLNLGTKTSYMVILVNEDERLLDLSAVYSGTDTPVDVTQQRVSSVTGCELLNIPAARVFDDIELTIDGSAVTVNIGSFVKAVISGPYDAHLIDAVTALYHYSASAKDFFTSVGKA